MNQYGKIGKPQLRTLPLAENIFVCSGTYTFSGRVLLTYQLAGDAPEYYRLATLNDDGSGFLDIFAGEIKKLPGANGIRFMCFADNRRVLLGDYVLECTPDLDCCTKSALIPVVYPPMDSAPSPYNMRWSEIVVSPDNDFMAWTVLSGISGAMNFLARLVRKADHYALEDIKEIGNRNMFTADEQNPGYVKMNVMRGGEIKQFVRGGAALSIAGMGADTKIADSVVLDLVSGQVTQITHTPCYDETTIFSPDEKLGIVMSTRFSPGTNGSILVMLPRPYARLSLMDLILPVYMMSVTNVRMQGNGNIGPALIEIDRSLSEEGYEGINLSDPQGHWVYHSPLSWHPDSQRAMWNEREVGSDGKGRVRIAFLPDYTSSEPVAVVPVPTNISYARPVDCMQVTPVHEEHDIKIKGGYSGCFSVKEEGCKKVYAYETYSDDGKTFYAGEETFSRMEDGCLYTADICVSGETSGSMKLQMFFAQKNRWDAAHIDFSADANGLPKTRGFAEYNGRRMEVETLNN